MDKAEVMAWLEGQGSKSVATGMARYGIVTQWRVIGVSVGTMQGLAKRLKKEMDAKARHALAADLWSEGCYEARMLATMVDDPGLVTVKQMDAWARDFDNWGICDTACFHLFDKTPLAWGRVRAWAKSPREFVRRGAFALLASLALHDKQAADGSFLGCLPLVEKYATDERNFVKKGVNWALRAMGRRGAAVRDAAAEMATRLAESEDATSRWVGKDALRAFGKKRAKVREGKGSGAAEGDARHGRISGKKTAKPGVGGKARRSK